MPKITRFGGKLLLVIIWLAMTLSMAGWWMIFGLKLLRRFSDSHSARTMLIWEGGTWMVLLLAGGLTLIYFLFRERRQAEQIRQFVAAFSHDLKTSLASLRLQAESLKDDLVGSPSIALVDRLVGDTLRLQLQLENSLYLAAQQNLRLFIETVSMQKMVEGLRQQWPGLDIVLEKEVKLQADQKALSSIVNNLAQNAVVHGQASCLHITAMAQGGKHVCLTVQDNGRGFVGPMKGLGSLFVRNNPSSGSGVGLFIVRQLAQKMNGDVKFHVDTNTSKFRIELLLEGQLT